MEIRITGTTELRDLTIKDNNGIEWTSDLLGNANALHYNESNGFYEMSHEDFDWWDEYIEYHKCDAEEITALAEELKIEESEIYDRINEHITNDLGDEHSVKQFVIAELRKNTNKSKLDITQTIDNLKGMKLTEDYKNEIICAFDTTSEEIIVSDSSVGYQAYENIKGSKILMIKVEYDVIKDVWIY